MASKRICLFDVDGTLTKPRQVVNTKRQNNSKF